MDKSILYIIIYTIFASLFYTLSGINNNIANSVILILGVMSYYFGLKGINVDTIDIFEERVKLVIALICLVTFTVIFYIYGSGFLYQGTLLFATLMLFFLVLYTLLLSNQSTVLNTKMKESLTYLFGFVVSAIFIAWFAYIFGKYMGNNNTIVGFVLNLLLMVLILGFIYKAIQSDIYSSNPNANAKSNAFFSMISSTFLYIPCLVSGLFNRIGALFAAKSTAKSTTKFTTNTTSAELIGSLLMLLVIAGIILIYFLAPYLINYFSTQGGNQLVNKPVYTDTVYTLGSYSDLNGSDDFDYQYAISCWIFIDAAPPNTSPSYAKYTSLLNFGEKPNLLYNGQTNTFMITMQQKNLQNSTKNKLIDFDEKGNRIIYVDKNMLLQKWNNVIINYTGGTLDVFINGQLVKSSIEVVPYYTLDNLTIGEQDGIKGGICNVVYYRRALSKQNIYYIYNSVQFTPFLI